MKVSELMQLVEEDTFVIFEEPEEIGILAAGTVPMNTAEINERVVLSIYPSTLNASKRSALCIVVQEE